MTFEQIAKTSQLDKALLKVFALMGYLDGNLQSYSFEHSITSFQVCLHTLSCGPPVFRLLEKEPRNNEVYLLAI